MSSDKRKPDFYRVARDGIDGRHYFDGNGSVYTSKVNYAMTFTSKSVAEQFAKDTAGRIVPVYVKVTRKPKLHDFAWALRQMRAGKKVRRETHGKQAYISIRCGGVFHWNDTSIQWPPQVSDLLATDWQLYEPEETKGQ